MVTKIPNTIDVNSTTILIIFDTFPFKKEVNTTAIKPRITVNKGKLITKLISIPPYLHSCESFQRFHQDSTYDSVRINGWLMQA